MKLDPDRMLDRRRLKRGITVWRVLAILAVAALIIVAIGRFVGGGPAGGDHIARLWVTGLIYDYAGRGEVLAEIAEDDDIKAVILRINSPGGTMAGSEALYLGLREIAARKPLVAVMDTTAASGGYLAALAAERIVARNSTVTGSIGVILQTADVTQMLEELGVSTEAIKSAPLKGAPSPFEPLDEGVLQLELGDEPHPIREAVGEEQHEPMKVDLRVLALPIVEVEVHVAGDAPEHRRSRPGGSGRW